MLLFSSSTQEKKIDFPSVTFCKKYPYLYTTPTLLEHVKAWEKTGNASNEDVKGWVLDKSTSKENMFEFFHHTTEARQFPCDTKLGAGLNSFIYKLYYHFKLMTPHF